MANDEITARDWKAVGRKIATLKSRAKSQLVAIAKEQSRIRADVQSGKLPAAEGRKAAIEAAQRGAIAKAVAAGGAAGVPAGDRPALASGLLSGLAALARAPGAQSPVQRRPEASSQAMQERMHALKGVRRGAWLGHNSR